VIPNLRTRRRLKRGNSEKYVFFSYNIYRTRRRLKKGNKKTSFLLRMSSKRDN
jgi:hypothetical protein